MAWIEGNGQWTLPIAAIRESNGMQQSLTAPRAPLSRFAPQKPPTSIRSPEFNERRVVYSIITLHSQDPQMGDLFPLSDYMIRVLAMLGTWLVLARWLP